MPKTLLEKSIYFIIGIALLPFLLGIMLCAFLCRF